MKPKLILIASGLTVAWLTLPALAADKTNRHATSHNLPSTNFGKLSRGERLGKTQKASDVVGMEVKNQREKLGKVKELAVDLQSGRVVAVILSTGGLLGIGDRHVAVPPRAFELDPEAKTLSLGLDQEKLKSAPEFNLSNWTEGSQEPALVEIYRFYGQEPYFVDKRRPGETVDGRNPARESRPLSGLGHVEKVTKVIGMPVRNLQEEQLGKVDDLQVDLTSGRIVQVIISSGGFLGLGDELSAVPPQALRFNASREEVRLDVTKDALSQAPHFKGKDWSDIDNPVEVERVYRAYRVEPYFTTNNLREVDSTARNVRDRTGNSLTPLDQGSNDADVNLTRRIRKEILTHDGLSTSARNIKVITVNGRVTLRGRVNTAEEKRLIGEIATRSTGGGAVDNQIEVEGK